MKPRLSILLAALAASALTSVAQQTSSLASMQLALKARADIATAVGRDATSPAQGLQQLRKGTNASGLGLSPDADLGYAALDVGHRLLAMHRPDAAEVFFRAAETAFQQASDRTSRGQAKEKAGYLQKLAFVRGNYLNKVDQAKADIDQAIQLQPGDKSLADTRTLITRGTGERFKEPKKS